MNKTAQQTAKEPVQKAECSKTLSEKRHAVSFVIQISGAVYDRNICCLLRVHNVTSFFVH